MKRFFSSEFPLWLFFSLPSGISDTSSDGVSSIEQSQAQTKIENLRKEFLDLWGYEVDRPNRINSRLVNKAAFILSIDEKKVLEDMQTNMYKDKFPAALESLICDKETLFSDDYEAYYVNHKLLKDIRSVTGMNNTDMALYCVDQALEDVSEKNKNSFKLSLEAIILHAKETNRSVERYYEKLRGINRKTALLEQLRKWIPDLSLNPANVVTFVNDCLRKYCAKYNELKLLEEDTGHYKPKYTQAQIEAADRYEATLKIITSYREELEKWEAKARLPDKGILSPFNNDATYDESVIEHIRQHTIEYLRSRSRSSKEPDVSTDDLNVILRQIKRTSLLPFLFLVLCARRGVTLFQRGLIDLDVVSNFESHIYSAKPKIYIQRLSRLAFLCKLCDTLRLNSDEARENLLYFIKYHGLRIDSKEEANQWEAVLNRYDLMDSPVSLGYRYYSLEKQCIPFKPSYLMCLERFSALHIDGLKSFMRRFPDYKGTLYKNTKTGKKPIPAKLKMDYLEEWSFNSLEKFSKLLDKEAKGYEYSKAYMKSRDTVKKICSKLSKEFEWRDPEAIHKWVNEWDREEISITHRTHLPIDEDELKRILIECIIQDELNQKAQDKLYELLLEALDKK